MSLLTSKSKEWIDYPKPNEIFNHYKGGQYQVITLAEHTENQERLVIYKSLLFGSVHARPLSVWNEKVQTQVQVPNFNTNEYDWVDSTVKRFERC